MGAPSHFLFFLIELESLLITLFSIVLSVGLLMGAIMLFQDLLLARYGLYVEPMFLTTSSFYIIAAMMAASAVVSVIPSMSGYRRAAATA